MEKFFTFGCVRHKCALSGTPKFRNRGGRVERWSVDLSEMYCAGSQAEFRADDANGQACVSSWRAGEA